MKRLRYSAILLLLMGKFVAQESRYTPIIPQSQTLCASYDAAIGYHDGAGTAANNYGQAVQNAAYCIPSVASSSGYNVNRALLFFDLSNIPAHAYINSAKLNLYALGATGSLPGHSGTSNGAYIERLTQAWQENSVTWNNQPSSTSVNRVTLNPTQIYNLDYLNIDLTSLIKDIIHLGSSNYGFILRLINEAASNSLLFASEDNANKSLCPTLVINYESETTGITETDRTNQTLWFFQTQTMEILLLN